MTVINIGSMNIDHIYTVPHFVRPAQTMNTNSLTLIPGGKGLNQSIALARAGVNVKHASLVGTDAAFLVAFMQENGVDVSMIETVDMPNGHAIIQVQEDGQNAIFLHLGSNMAFTPEYIERVLASANPETDLVLLQNEINDIPLIIEQAKGLGLKVVLNVAPATEDVRNYPLEMLDMLIINEVEGETISGETEPTEMVKTLRKAYPNTSVVLTLGELGVMYADAEHSLTVPAVWVDPVIDTTSAGDTFIGFFLGSWLNNMPLENALQFACRASALCVQRSGSSSSIPHLSELS